MLGTEEDGNGRHQQGGRQTSGSKKPDMRLTRHQAPQPATHEAAADRAAAAVCFERKDGCGQKKQQMT